jgi:DNA-binding XRE family transcriptional regulator
VNPTTTFVFSGEKMAARRIAQGLQREHLAVAIHKTADTVRRHEAGTLNPPASTVGTYAGLLGCTPSDLYETAETGAER